MWVLLVLLGAVGSASSVWGTGARVADAAAKLALSRIDPVWTGVVRILNATSVVADAADTFRMQLPALGKKKRRSLLLLSALGGEAQEGLVMEEDEAAGGGVFVDDATAREVVQQQAEEEEQEEDSYASVLAAAEEEQAGGDGSTLSRRRLQQLAEEEYEVQDPPAQPAAPPRIQPLVPLSATKLPPRAAPSSPSDAAAGSNNVAASADGGILGPLRRISDAAEKQERLELEQGQVEDGGADPSDASTPPQQHSRDQQQKKRGGGGGGGENGGEGGIGAFFANIGKAIGRSPLMNATQAQSAARAAGSVVANITNGLVNPMIEAVGGPGAGGGRETALQQGIRAATNFLLPPGSQNQLLNALDGVVDTVRDRLLNATGCPVYCVDLRGFTPEANPMTNGVPAGPIIVLGNGCLCDLERVRLAAPILPTVAPRVDASGALLAGMGAALGGLMMHAAAQWARMRTEAALVAAAEGAGAELDGAPVGGEGASGPGDGGSGESGGGKRAASPLLAVSPDKLAEGSGGGGGKQKKKGESSSSGGGAAGAV
jgi:hypothetical protein